MAGAEWLWGRAMENEFRKVKGERLHITQDCSSLKGTWLLLWERREAFGRFRTKAWCDPFALFKDYDCDSCVENNERGWNKKWGCHLEINEGV